MSTLLPSALRSPPGGGQRSVGHGRCTPFNSGIFRGGRSRLCLGALFFLPQVFKPFFFFYHALPPQLLPETSAPELSGTCDRPIKAAWGALPSLIPGHSQINRVSVSVAVWPLSHIKSGPFRLFDLTSISHVIDSPRDLFFSPHI